MYNMSHRQEISYFSLLILSVVFVKRIGDRNALNKNLYYTICDSKYTDSCGLANVYQRRQRLQTKNLYRLPIFPACITQALPQ